MISHHHHTLFVHIPKCGGQSIEHAFLRALDLTWENRAPLLLRQQVDGELAPPRLAHLLLKDYLDNRYLSPALYATYFKFAVIRNPFERVVSFYRYLKIDKKKAFEDFVHDDLSGLLNPAHPSHWFFRPQVDYLQSPAAQPGLDAVYRLEHLAQAWPLITVKAGLGNVPLPHVNKSHTSTGTPITPLSDSSRKIIRQLYQADFDAFPEYRECEEALAARR